MRKKGLKKFLCSSLAIMFLVIQAFFTLGKEVKAEVKTGVEVFVTSNDKILAQGNSTEYNAYKALEEVLRKNNVKIQTKDESYGKYIEAIGDIKSKKFGGYDGWLYAVNRKGTYENITVPIDKFTLKEGDRLIVFYGDMGTLTANKLEYSTNLPNKELKITLNNTYTDFQTKKEVVQPIKGIKAKIDGKEVKVKDNVILIEKGLSEGEHALELVDFSENKPPKVVSDVIKFTIGNASKKSEFTMKITSINEEIDETVNYIKQNEKYDLWSEISMIKLSVQPNAKFIESRNEYILKNYENVKKNGTKNINNIEMEKLIMTLVNAGYSPYDFGKTNLVKDLYSRDINKLLINDVIFGLITLNYCNINDYKEAEESYINYLLDKKLINKIEGRELVGWSYSGDKIDVDITAMAISSLSKYYSSNKEVKNVIDKAIDTLAYLQDEKGYMPNIYGVSSEAISASINALTSLGISPEEGKFLKNDGDLVTALISFKKDSGKFKHAVENEDFNYISSEQALRALISLKEFKKNGEYNYYSSKNVGELKKYGSNLEKSLFANSKAIAAVVVGAIAIFSAILIRRKKAA
ncbi:hypothetical protein GOM49_12015 [Clostridium bovifaecis]|uniref:DUF4430 domain-containing protein n=1 Tax=Clostridium bovifaecis TaxID=2184719 RepID=A0A6I6F5W7_9CLOT|nr:hypothetical protein GOM49_12015 [Clostridium bovifaecis]